MKCPMCGFEVDSIMLAVHPPIEQYKCRRGNCPYHVLRRQRAEMTAPMPGENGWKAVPRGTDVADMIKEI